MLQFYLLGCLCSFYLLGLQDALFLLLKRCCLDKSQRFPLVLAVLAILLITKGWYESDYKKVQRVEGICFGGTFIDGKCRSDSLPIMQSVQSEQHIIQPSVEAARMDREASRGDGIRQPKAHRTETHSKAVSEGGISHQGRSSYLLCAVSHGEGTGDDGNKSLQALFPQDVEDVEAARITRCRVYSIADNNE